MDLFTAAERPKPILVSKCTFAAPLHALYRINIWTCTCSQSVPAPVPVPVPVLHQQPVGRGHTPAGTHSWSSPPRMIWPGWCSTMGHRGAANLSPRVMRGCWWRLNPRPSMEGPRILRGARAAVGGSVVGAVPGEL